jgi:hypothetical protein
LEFVHESAGIPFIDKQYQETATSNIYLRLSRSPSAIKADYSIGGSVWTNLGSIAQHLQNPRLAIFVGASPSAFPNADLAWVHITTAPYIGPGPPYHYSPEISFLT